MGKSRVICFSCCNSMLSIQVSSLMNRKGAFHSLRTNTLKVPSLIFLVVTLGTFGRQPVEDLRVYVRGQKMIDSLGCREDWKTFSALETFRGLHYVATFSKTHIFDEKFRAQTIAVSLLFCLFWFSPAVIQKGKHAANFSCLFYKLNSPLISTACLLKECICKSHSKASFLP